MEDLLSKLQAEMLEAVKAGESVKADILRLVVADVKAEKINTPGEVKIERVYKIIQSHIKAMKEAQEQYTAAGKSDLAQKESVQIAVLEKYLPQMLSEEEVAKVVEEVIATASPTGMQDMGKVMGIAMQKLAGKADGTVVQQVVKEKLSAI